MTFVRGFGCLIRKIMIMYLEMGRYVRYVLGYLYYKRKKITVQFIVNDMLWRVF